MSEEHNEAVDLHGLSAFIVVTSVLSSETLVGEVQWPLTVDTKSGMYRIQTPSSVRAMEQMHVKRENCLQHGSVYSFESPLQI
jgi:hypothetical protein